MGGSSTPMTASRSEPSLGGLEKEVDLDLGFLEKKADQIIASVVDQILGEAADAVLSEPAQICEGGEVGGALGSDLEGREQSSHGVSRELLVEKKKGEPSAEKDVSALGVGAVEDSRSRIGDLNRIRDEGEEHKRVRFAALNRVHGVEEEGTTTDLGFEFEIGCALNKAERNRFGGMCSNRNRAQGFKLIRTCVGGVKSNRNRFAGSSQIQNHTRFGGSNRFCDEGSLVEEEKPNRNRFSGLKLNRFRGSSRNHSGGTLRSDRSFGRNRGGSSFVHNRFGGNLAVEGRSAIVEPSAFEKRKQGECLKVGVPQASSSSSLSHGEAQCTVCHGVGEAQCTVNLEGGEALCTVHPVVGEAHCTVRLELGEPQCTVHQELDEAQCTVRPARETQNTARPKERCSIIASKVSVDLPSSSLRVGKSWSEVVSGGRQALSSVKINFVAPSLVDGVPTAVCSPEELAENSKPWLCSLVGCVVGKRPHFVLLKKHLERIWKTSKSFEAFSREQGQFLFRFSSEQDCAKILEGGPWFFEGRLIVLKRWKQGSWNDSMLSCVPVWMRLPGLPIELWAGPTLNKIVSVVGTPLSMDAETANQTRLNFARVCG